MTTVTHPWRSLHSGSRGRGFSHKCEPFHTRPIWAGEKSGTPDGTLPSNGGRYIRQSRDRGKFRDAVVGLLRPGGLWDPAQKFAGPKGRPGLTTPRRSKRSHPHYSQPRLADLALQPRCQEGRSDISRVFGAMLSIPLRQADRLQRIRGAGAERIGAIP